MRFNTFRDYARYIEKKFPRDGRPEAAFAHAIMCGWRCECGKSGVDPTLKAKSLTPVERAATEAEAARWLAEARRQGEMAQAHCYNGTPAAELASAWLAYKGRSPDGRLLE